MSSFAFSFSPLMSLPLAPPWKWSRYSLGICININTHCWYDIVYVNVYCSCKRSADSFLTDILFTVLLIWSSKFAVLCVETVFESPSWSNEETSNCQNEKLSLKSLNASHWKASTCDSTLQEDCFSVLLETIMVIPLKSPWNYYFFGGILQYLL